MENKRGILVGLLILGLLIVIAGAWTATQDDVTEEPTTTIEEEAE